MPYPFVFNLLQILSFVRMGLSVSYCVMFPCRQTRRLRLRQSAGGDLCVVDAAYFIAGCCLGSKVNGSIEAAKHVVHF